MQNNNILLWWRLEHSAETSAKLFSELKLVTDNLSLQHIHVWFKRTCSLVPDPRPTPVWISIGLGMRQENTWTSCTNAQALPQNLTRTQWWKQICDVILDFWNTPSFFNRQQITSQQEDNTSSPHYGCNRILPEAIIGCIELGDIIKVVERIQGR